MQLCASQQERRWSVLQIAGSSSWLAVLFLAVIVSTTFAITEGGAKIVEHTTTVQGCSHEI